MTSSVIGPRGADQWACDFLKAFGIDDKCVLRFTLDVQAGQHLPTITVERAIEFLPEVKTLTEKYQIGTIDTIGEEQE